MHIMGHKAVDALVFPFASLIYRMENTFDKVSKNFIGINIKMFYGRPIMSPFYQFNGSLESQEWKDFCSTEMFSAAQNSNLSFAHVHKPCRFWEERKRTRRKFITVIMSFSLPRKEKREASIRCFTSSTLSKENARKMFTAEYFAA